MISLFKNKLTIFGLIIIGVLFLTAVLAPVIAPYEPDDIDVSNILAGPQRAHFLGTDELGRDILSRMIYGARISLTIGFISVGIAVTIGVILGSIAGYYGRWADAVIMRFVDIMLCFPTLFLILAVVAILGPSIINIMIVIGVTSWMGMTRLIRAEILSLKEREFIEAARALGAGNLRIICRHLIPNAIQPVLVSATLGVGAAIMVESVLSFLGIGVQPPVPTWGRMLAESKSVIGLAPWATIFPGLAILITVLGYNLLGEGLRDALDPRRRGK